MTPRLPNWTLVGDLWGPQQTCGGFWVPWPTAMKPSRYQTQSQIYTWLVQEDHPTCVAWGVGTGGGLGSDGSPSSWHKGVKQAWAKSQLCHP